MTTQQFELTDHQADFIRASVEGGSFRDSSDVIAAGLRLLEQQQASDRLKLEHLRRLVREGFESIERGEYEVVTADTLDAFMDSVSATARANGAPK